jgi:hypothetical protein
MHRCAAATSVAKSISVESDVKGVLPLGDKPHDSRVVDVPIREMNLYALTFLVPLAVTEHSNRPSFLLALFPH